MEKLFDDMINQKLHKVILEGLFPILCIGETIDERNDGRTDIVLKNQLESAFKDLNKLNMRNLVIAYEPI